MARKLTFLVVDGYSKDGRDDLKAGGASTAGELYREMLNECSQNAEVEIVYPADSDTNLPSGDEIQRYDGVAWTGSSLTIYKDDPVANRQVEFARDVYSAQVPQFGSCWGLQIATVAAGGICAAHPDGREMGIARKIRLTEEGRGHPMYTGKKSVFNAYISHDDEITHAPPNSTILAGNDHCYIQAIDVTHNGGRFWAVQYHPEYNLHEMARLTYCRKEKLTNMGFFSDTDSAMDYVDDLETLHENPDRKDIAWKLGIDEDVMNKDVRQVEVRNWIDKLVLPNARE